jgi:hypothetical protein
MLRARRAGDKVLERKMRYLMTRLHREKKKRSRARKR